MQNRAPQKIPPPKKNPPHWEDLPPLVDALLEPIKVVEGASPGRRGYFYLKIAAPLPIHVIIFSLVNIELERSK